SLLALDDALGALERADPEKARLVEMRYFGGMTAEETAAALSMPVHVVRRDLRLAEAWLRREVAGAADSSLAPCRDSGHERQRNPFPQGCRAFARGAGGLFRGTAGPRGGARGGRGVAALRSRIRPVLRGIDRGVGAAVSRCGSRRRARDPL